MSGTRFVARHGRELVQCPGVPQPGASAFHPAAPSPQELATVVSSGFCISLVCIQGDPSDFIPGLWHGAYDPVAGIVKAGLHADSALFSGDFGQAAADFNGIMQAPAEGLYNAISDTVADPRAAIDSALHPSYATVGRAGGGLAVAVVGGLALGTVSSVAAGDAQLLNELSTFRQELGLPVGEGTLAKLEAGGREFWGINAHGQSVLPLRVNAISATHAEADAFAQAARAGISSGPARLLVDRALCPACGLYGGVRSMARQLGLDSLTIVSPAGTFAMLLK